MIGLIVKKDGVVLEKKYFFGDDKENMNLVEKEKEGNSDKEFDVYTHDQRETFDSIKVPHKKSDRQMEWASLKGSATESEKLFAKVLGLE